MEKRGFLERHGVVRSSIRKDLIQFALPALTVFIIELQFCVSDGLSGFWGTVWGLIKQPGNLSLLPLQSITGLALFLTGLTIMLVGQTTLWRNYSGTVLIRADHQLITHGIYRFTRNTIYLGGIMAITGIPVYVASLYGFLSSLVLIPIILNRIRLEEKLLTKEFPDAFVRYKETTRKLIPFIY